MASKKKRPTSTSRPHAPALKPKTKGQSDYLKSIQANILTICNGPAGTGKTMLAVSAALQMIRNKEYHNIVIVRPAVPACNEQLGFLPGEVNDKMSPFMVPVIHNLQKLTNQSEFQQLQKNVIKVIPLAFMRGLTLENCIVILDEAQNTKIEQMKMFLTRIGQNCKVIVEGDEKQSDIRQDNGLEDAIRRLDNLPDVGIVTMTKKDIIRSEFISQIIQRYEPDTNK